METSENSKNRNASRLISYLGGLNEHEFYSLKNFVNSPVFNTNKQLIALYNTLAPFVKDGNLNKWDKKTAFHKIYSKNKDYKDETMRSLMSKLCDVIEQMWIHNWQKSNENILLPNDLVLINVFHDKTALSHEFERLSDIYSKKIDAEKILDFDYYFRKIVFLTAWQHYYGQGTMFNEVQVKIQNDRFDAIVKYFIILALDAYRCAGQSRYNNAPILLFRYQFKDEIEKFLKANNHLLEEVPTIGVAYYLMKLHETKVEKHDETKVEKHDEIKVEEHKEIKVEEHKEIKVEEHNETKKEDCFFKAISLLEQKEDMLSEIDKYNLVTDLANFALEMVLKGFPEWAETRFNLYKEFFEKKWFKVVGEQLTPINFRLIAISACDAGKFEWCEQFIKEQLQFVGCRNEEEREIIRIITTAHLHSARGEYEDAVNILRTLSHKREVIYFLAYSELIMCYIELIDTGKIKLKTGEDLFELFFKSRDTLLHTLKNYENYKERQDAYRLFCKCAYIIYKLVTCGPYNFNITLFNELFEIVRDDKSLIQRNYFARKLNQLRLKYKKYFIKETEI